VAQRRAEPATPAKPYHDRSGAYDHPDDDQPVAAVGARPRPNVRLLASPVGRGLRDPWSRGASWCRQAYVLWPSVVRSRRRQRSPITTAAAPTIIPMICMARKPLLCPETIEHTRTMIPTSMMAHGAIGDIAASLGKRYADTARAARCAQRSAGGDAQSSAFRPLARSDAHEHRIPGCPAGPNEDARLTRWPGGCFNR
jgi:hypothetical protein